MLQVEPGFYDRVTALFARASLTLASRVPARAQFSPRSAPSFGFVDGRRNGHAYAHSGRFRVRSTGLECGLHKLHARADWEEQSLFDALLPSALAHCPGRFVPVALDDTRLKKPGHRIPTAFWQRDPLSPPFRMNDRAAQTRSSGCSGGPTPLVVGATGQSHDGNVPRNQQASAQSIVSKQGATKHADQESM